MRLIGFVPCLLAILMLNIDHATAQVTTEFRILKEASLRKANEEKIDFKKLLQLSKERGWKMMTTGKNGRVILLSGIDPLGYPLYVSTDNNIVAAASIKTNLLWPMGSTGLNLTGSSANIAGKIGIWDGGKVRNTHVELAGRVTQKDNILTLNDHATHVAGTMIAKGVNPIAKGMSYGTQQLLAYDFKNDESEMLAEAGNLLISNHSYGNLAGWHYNDVEKRWDFWGPVNSVEDYKFGYYSSEAQIWDSIAYNAPNYLIVKSAGNDRNDNGPAVGQPYWRMNATGQWVNAGNRPAGISNNNGFDNIPTYGTAKNILTVGAINPIFGGFSTSPDAVISNFSSWGPTDDGRIKPDVVADGVNIVSSISTSDNAYANYSGTSMAAPAASGSLFLLQEYYSKINGAAFLRSATLKGLVIHTADDGGNIGPDYQYGWGVINMEKAAAVITAKNTTHLINQNTLASGGNFPLAVVASGQGPLKVTICWTDPKANVETGTLLNNSAKKLINDLDIRVTRSTTTTFLPWILAPASPSSPATTGDNTLDNTEQIVINDPIPGETYTIVVSHKGTLSRGSQAYSLIVSGIGGQPYCASSPLSTAGGRIDKVTVGSFSLTSPASVCTGYSNNTASTIPLEAGQPVPVSVNVSSCDASSASKIVKIFIDYNNDGDFIDAGETVAQSAAINGNGSFSGNFTVPGTALAGFSTVMRVIVQQTATAADVNPCGSYSNGETQDYRVRFTTASNDLGVTEIVSPFAASCANAAQLVTVRIKNFGAVKQVNVPLTLTIRNGATTVATSSIVCADTIHAYSDVIFTFQTPFNAIAANTYSITATASLGADQNAQNNSVTASVTISNASSAPTGTAAICGTNLVSFTAPLTTPGLPVWYSTASSNSPIAAGYNATSSVITADKTYYLALNEITTRVGPPARATLGTGGYASLTNNYLKFTNAVPLTIEHVRLFVGAPGKITLIVADIITSSASTYTYSTIASTTIDVYSTGNTTTDPGALFYVNLPVPTVGDHILIVQFQNGATLYRNNAVSSNPYPISIPNIISITGNSAINASDTTDASFYQRFYYFVYDIGVKLSGCATPRAAIVATTAVPPVITQAGNVFTSNAATGNQWYLNRILIAGATSQTYTAIAAGVYKTIVNNTGCPSNEINYATTPVIDLNGSTIALVASPNPNKGRFFLQFEVKGKDDLIISLLNSVGQEVYRDKTAGFTGRYAQQVNTGQTSAGLYILKIQHNKKLYIKKILIQ